MTLASYQHKYEKLEQNFKKFTSNLVNPNAQDQVMEDLKYKAGLSLLEKLERKAQAADGRRAWKLWKLNAGIVMRQFDSQHRTSLLAKYANKVYQRSLQHLKFECYQKWKKEALGGGEGNLRDRVVSTLSQMITNSEDFNRCVENDFYLSLILSSKLSQLLGIVSSDLFFYDNGQADGDGITEFKTYHHQSGEQINFNIQSVMQSSVLG